MHYRLDEITPVHAGQFDTHHGCSHTSTLMTTCASKTKQFLSELPVLLASAEKVKAKYIQLT